PFPFPRFVSLFYDQTFGHRHLRHVKIIVAEIVVEKLGGRAEHKFQLYIFRFDGPIQQRSETRVKSTKKFQFKHSRLLSRRTSAPRKFRSLVPAANARQQATLYRWPGGYNNQGRCREGRLPTQWTEQLQAACGASR